MKMPERAERREIAEKRKIDRIIETKAVGAFRADPRGRKHAN